MRGLACMAGVRKGMRRELFSSLYCHLGEKLSLKKRYQRVPRRSEMQSEYKEKQEDAKGKL